MQLWKRECAAPVTYLHIIYIRHTLIYVAVVTFPVLLLVYHSAERYQARACLIKQVNLSQAF